MHLILAKAGGQFGRPVARRSRDAAGFARKRYNQPPVFAARGRHSCRFTSATMIVGLSL